MHFLKYKNILENWEKIPKVEILPLFSISIFLRL